MALVEQPSVWETMTVADYIPWLITTYVSQAQQEGAEVFHVEIAGVTKYTTAVRDPTEKTPQRIISTLLHSLEQARIKPNELASARLQPRGTVFEPSAKDSGDYYDQVMEYGEGELVRVASYSPYQAYPIGRRPDFDGPRRSIFLDVLPAAGLEEGLREVIAQPPDWATLTVSGYVRWLAEYYAAQAQRESVRFVRLVFSNLSGGTTPRRLYSRGFPIPQPGLMINPGQTELIIPQGFRVQDPMFQEYFGQLLTLMDEAGLSRDASARQHVRSAETYITPDRPDELDQFHGGRQRMVVLILTTKPILAPTELGPATGLEEKPGYDVAVAKQVIVDAIGQHPPLPAKEYEPPLYGGSHLTYDMSFEIVVPHPVITALASALGGTVEGASGLDYFISIARSRGAPGEPARYHIKVEHINWDQRQYPLVWEETTDPTQILPLLREVLAEPVVQHLFESAAARVRAESGPGTAGTSTGWTVSDAGLEERDILQVVGGLRYIETTVLPPGGVNPFPAITWPSRSPLPEGMTEHRVVLNPLRVFYTTQEVGGSLAALIQLAEQKDSPAGFQGEYVTLMPRVPGIQPEAYEVVVKAAGETLPDEQALRDRHVAVIEFTTDLTVAQLIQQAVAQWLPGQAVGEVLRIEYKDGRAAIFV